MPAKKQVTKEMILGAALRVLMEGGTEAVNVKSLAAELGCRQFLFQKAESYHAGTVDFVERLCVRPDTAHRAVFGYFAGGKVAGHLAGTYQQHL